MNNPPHAVRITGDPHPVTTRHLRNKWFLPFTRGFHATYPSGRQHIIMNCATPIDDRTMQLCQWLYRNDTEADCATAELIAWDRAIVDEDRAILEATEYDVCIDIRHGVECHGISVLDVLDCCPLCRDDCSHRRMVNSGSVHVDGHAGSRESEGFTEEQRLGEPKAR